MTLYIIGMLIRNFKMKFELILSCETAIKCYGKGWIGWHGYCMQHLLIESIAYEHGVIHQKLIKYMVYLDKVLEDGNRHDNCTVVFLLEADISQCINDLPFIKEVFLQSENAKWY